MREDRRRHKCDRPRRSSVDACSQEAGRSWRGEEGGRQQEGRTDWSFSSLFLPRCCSGRRQPLYVLGGLPAPPLVPLPAKITAKDEQLWLDSELTLKHEIVWASYLSVQACVLPPLTRSTYASYARVVNNILQGLTNIQGKGGAGRCRCSGCSGGRIGTAAVSTVRTRRVTRHGYEWLPLGGAQLSGGRRPEPKPNTGAMWTNRAPWERRSTTVWEAAVVEQHRSPVIQDAEEFT